ncbi:selenium cofactor biosynthesis protein YqeC [Fusobacterium sp.]|uniref:selenium cofactor biosynthesis protein YqeC n=1 Tax=Fusobacterium sp. TaxID=68766 RepID=UPI0026277697|nr:selenium cofactor biosynthesis protein YqeC [Fusobacterium sp.]
MFEKFNIKKGDIITVTGAGGKTSLIYLLSEELSKKGKVLITTTTKIYIPPKEKFESLEIIEERIKIFGDNKNIFVIGKSILGNKIIGVDYQEVERLKEKFDYILVEGDGAKEKILKDWNETEPCIFPSSTKVIGVINLNILDLKINEENIHRFEIFKRNYSEYLEKKLDLNFLIKFILKGKFFHNSLNSEKYIFFNEVNTVERKEIVEKIRDRLAKENIKIVY